MVPQSHQHPQREIWEHTPRPRRIRRAGPRRNRRQGPDDLRKQKRKRHMVPRQRLQQDHAETHPLDTVEHRDPTPQRTAKDSSKGRRAEGDIGTDAADAP